MLNDNIYDISSKEYADIRYILSCGIRTRILLYLSESDKTFTQMKSSLKNQQKTNILRALKELTDFEYVFEYDKKYYLTTTGKLVTMNIITFIKNMTFVKSYDYFLSKHSLDHIPFEVIRHIHVLNDAKLMVSDTVEYNKTIDFYIEKIQYAHNIKVALPIFSRFHIDAILNALINNNTTLELITSQMILDAINDSPLQDKFNKLLDNNQISLFVCPTNKVKFFFTLCDEFYSASFFYKDGTFDESSLFYSEKTENYEEMEIIFNLYKSNFKKT